MFGLGFVLSFGYWTTNFVEVQRAMASDSIASARKTPIIGSFPKMFVPFLTIIPGMIAAVLVPEIIELKNGEEVPGGASGKGVAYNDSMLYLMRDLLPNGLLGLAITGLLAAFMAGMAANISAFNTVFSYDLWERYIRKDRADDYYLRIGRVATVGATVIAIFTAILASSFSNIMDYLQTLFGFFNAPLFATFILGMFWKRMTGTAAWIGLVAGTLAAVLVAFLSEDAFGSLSLGVIPLGGQGAAFVAASAGVHRGRRVVGGDLAVHQADTAGGPRRSGLLGDTEGDPSGPTRAHLPLVPAHPAARGGLARHGHRPQHPLLSRSSHGTAREEDGRDLRHPQHHRGRCSRSTA